MFVIAWITFMIGLWTCVLKESITAREEIRQMEKQTEEYEQRQQEKEKHREESGQNEQLRKAMQWKKTQCQKENNSKQGGFEVKGFYTDDGYMGWVDGKYRLFACEEDYHEYMEENA